MAFGIDDAITAASKLIDDGINKIWPSVTEKSTAEAITIKATADAAIQTLAAQMSVMLEEAKSNDPWTSRARPSFLYVMYAMILAAIPMGVCSAISPSTATAVASGMQSWLAAIPGDLWSCFGFGYGGYLLHHGATEAGGIMPLITGKKK